MKFSIVTDPVLCEFSLHQIENEELARRAITKAQQKGRNIEHLVISANNWGAAARIAEKRYPNYHHVKDVLAPR